MDVQTRTAEPAAVVVLSGRLDARTAPSVAAELARLTAASPRIVVNLALVTLLDSAGLATLVAAWKRCRLEGGDLRVAELRSPVDLVFRLTRVDKVLGIYDTESAAVDSFGG